MGDTNQWAWASTFSLIGREGPRRQQTRPLLLTSCEPGLAAAAPQTDFREAEQAHERAGFTEVVEAKEIVSLRADIQ